MKKIFITATGTGTGKTFTCAGLAGICIGNGLKTAYMKPVRTGTETDDDPAFVKSRAPSLFKLPPGLECQYAFPFPASPHLSAKLAGSEIRPEKIISSAGEIEKIKGLDILLIEGAGGVCVPLRENYMMLDLIKELGAPAIIVSPAGLGSINHAVLTARALENSKIPIAGIIFNQVSGKPSAVEEDNIKTIERLSSVPVLSVLPDIADITKINIASLFDKNKIGKMLDSL